MYQFFTFADQSRNLVACCLDVGCLNLVEYVVQFSVQLELFLISLKLQLYGFLIDFLFGFDLFSFNVELSR